MQVIGSREFLVALLSFLTPVAIAAVLVYRRVRQSDVWHRRAAKASPEDSVPAVAVAEPAELRAAAAACELPEVEPVEPQVAEVAVPAVPVTMASLRQPMANLRQRLVEFRTSIQHSCDALEELQECDSRFSLDLSRASEVMHHAFPQ